MRSVSLVLGGLVLSSMMLLAQSPDYSTLERGDRAKPSSEGSSRPAAKGTWRLATRLFEAQWPEGKAPTGEWRVTATERKWVELTCLYPVTKPDDFGVAKYTAQTVRVTFGSDGQAERAEFRMIPERELRGLENFYPGHLRR